MHDDLTPGLCQCGCGQPAPISPYTWAAQGYVKGQPRRFIAGHSRNKPGGSLRQRFDLWWAVEDRGYVTPCHIWQKRFTPDGYGNFQVYEDGKRRRRVAHRWRWEQEHGLVPPGMQLDHLCVQPACVRLDHLEVVTPIQNVRRSRLAKLDDTQAREIYRRRCAGEAVAPLAAEFGVSETTIYHIHASGPDAPRKSGHGKRASLG